MPNLARLLAVYALACLAALDFAATCRADPPPPVKEKIRTDAEELRRQQDDRSRGAALSHLLTALSVEKSDPRSAREHLEKCKALLDDDLAWLPKSSFSKQERKTLSRQLAVKIRDLKAYEVHHADILAALDKIKALSSEDTYWQAAEKMKPRFREIQIIKALNSTMTIDFMDTPFFKALDYMDEKADRHLNFSLDDPALKEAAFDPDDKTMTLRMKRYPIRLILKQALNANGLDYIIDDGMVRITTMQKAQMAKVTRVYNIAALLDAKNLERSKTELLDALNLALAKAAGDAKPASPAAGTEPARFVIFTHTGRLVVQASVETQLQIELLLAELKGVAPDVDLSGIDLDNNNRVSRP